jgi:hypothetical protein
MHIANIERLKREPNYREQVAQRKADEYISTSLRTCKGETWQGMVNTLQHNHDVPDEILTDVAREIIADRRVISTRNFWKPNSYILEYDKNNSQQQQR